MNFENFIQVEKEYHNKTTAVRWSEAKYGIKSAFFGFFQRSKVFPYPSVINAEKFIGSGSHIDIIRFAF